LLAGRAGPRANFSSYEKTPLRIALILLILVVLEILAVGLSLNTTIKKVVETLGTQITKVDIKLAGGNLFLFSGSGSNKGLVIGNPAGYRILFVFIDCGIDGRRTHSAF
jgi:hypothetical protein